jgi:hypothetical protein
MERDVMLDFIQGILDLSLHRYVRNGERVFVYNDNDEIADVGPAQFPGYSRYAPVRIGKSALVIRRDGITKDDMGRWFYKLEGA